MFHEKKGGQCGWTNLTEERVAQDNVLEVVRGEITYNLVSHSNDTEFKYNYNLSN